MREITEYEKTHINVVGCYGGDRVVLQSTRIMGMAVGSSGGRIMVE